MNQSNTPALDYYIDLLSRAETAFDEASTLEVREDANAFAEEISEHLLELEIKLFHLKCCFELKPQQWSPFA